MTRGYLVADNSSDPTGPSHEGRGSDAANQWLGRVKTLASSMCTPAVPFAQADLAPVPSVANPALTAPALTRPAAIDRKSVVEGKSVSGRVDLGGLRIITKK